MSIIEIIALGQKAHRSAEEQRRLERALKDLDDNLRGRGVFPGSTTF